MTQATLVLEDGSIITGVAFGAATDTVFELVFNTSMTGYQEILTDPSYRGQGILFTVSHIGNVGINLEDDESAIPQIAAVVTRSLSPAVSNWRSRQPLADWLAEHGVPGIADVDTRYLTRRLRDGGTQRAALSTCGASADALLARARAWPGLDGRDMVREVTCSEAYAWPDTTDDWTARSRQGRPQPAGPAGQPRPHVVAYDFGTKRNILRHLAASGARVTVVPADTSAADVLALRPDGVFLSNGPGDPAGLPYAVAAVRVLIEHGVPMLGICLGHQLVGLALGATTARLKFGHHGANHPVKDLRTGAVQITAQNHNYCVEAATLDPARVEITHVSLNDGSLEGFRLRDRPVLCVQYHPEAAPGPHDALDVFDEFFALMKD
ncbi:MAG: Carbamoyl-phosphate synthase small chain [Chloroflexi bacterium ADurb.Bin325]|nr:MAG: Carbamoyl-phosphate synthase small chain [Chloroflexi bacterium ADurb.Bin325]